MFPPPPLVSLGRLDLAACRGEIVTVRIPHELVEPVFTIRARRAIEKVSWECDGEGLSVNKRITR